MNAAVFKTCPQCSDEVDVYFVQYAATFRQYDRADFVRIILDFYIGDLPKSRPTDAFELQIICCRRRRTSGGIKFTKISANQLTTVRQECGYIWGLTTIWGRINLGGLATIRGACAPFPATPARNRHWTRSTPAVRHFPAAKFRTARSTYAAQSAATPAEARNLVTQRTMPAYSSDHHHIARLTP